MHILSFNRAEDINGDGIYSCPSEYLGIKSEFRRDEQIIVGCFSSRRVIGWRIKIWDDKGILFYDNTKTKESQGIGREFPPNYLRQGEYTAGFYFNDEHLRTLRFRVVE
jgi:hypothetical protein